MNRKHFESIKQAAAGHVSRVDSLIPDWQYGTARDNDFSDVVKRQRADARRADVQRRIEASAARAKEQASAAVDALRADFKKYMTTTSDPGALQSLQALINAGVELSPAEVETYAATGDYVTLRLLEPHSKGRVQAPSLDRFEMDMRDILGHFDWLAAYSGENCELADCVTARPLGQSARVVGAILKSSISQFPAKLAEIADRWSNVTNG